MVLICSPGLSDSLHFPWTATALRYFMERNKEERQKKRKAKVTGGPLEYFTHSVWQQKKMMEPLN